MSGDDCNVNLRRYYRWQAPIYDVTRRVFLRGRHAATSALGLRPGDHVLEIGCGTGLNLPSLSLDVGNEGRVVGVDLSMAMLSRARSRRSGQTHLVCSDATALPLTGSFGGILFSYALTVIPDWESALRWASDHLEPPGKIVVLDFLAPPRLRPIADWPVGMHLRLNHVDWNRDLVGAMQSLGYTVEQSPVGGLLARYAKILVGTRVS